MQLAKLLIDISPLRESRAFRYAYAARTATVLVTGMLLVAASIQLYELTASSVAVAALNVSLAVPMALALIVGGVLSDRLDRRKLMLWSRSVYIISVLLFLVNALLPQPLAWPIYVAAVIGGAAGGISVPAMMSATPALVG
ncbi:MAG: MFS transporter, partial [Pusillimonas sp.]